VLSFRIRYTARVRLGFVVCGIAVVAFGTARIARVVATDMRVEGIVDEPYAPSPSAAPVLANGYRELGADLMFVRLAGYFASGESTAVGMAAIVDAIVALDPRFHRIYEYGARAMTMAKHDVDASTYRHAIAVLERGASEFPDDWRMPFLAGQIYTQDLQTTDPAERRAWDEKGTLLIEAAVRKPGAPAEAAEWAAVMRTKFGQHQRAVDELREIILVTSDNKARTSLLARLAMLEHADAAELAAEVLEVRHRFEAAWKQSRPAIPATMYVLLGARLAPAPIDFAALATGGRDIVGSEAVEKLEPLE
jgi:hypothetical protein